MHIEHEEALRADFAEYVRLEQQAIRVSLAHHDGGYHPPPQALYDLTNQKCEVEIRWQLGPHAQRWDDLRDTYTMWKGASAEERRLDADLDDLDRPQCSDIDRRSVRQARMLAESTRACLYGNRPTVERGR